VKILQTALKMAAAALPKSEWYKTAPLFFTLTEAELSVGRKVWIDIFV
jgi:hypothetical protein